jgi:HK97 family phage portal protein
MGVLAKQVSRVLAQSPENPQTPLSDPAQWFIDWMRGGGETYTGTPVNELNAVRQTAVFRCVSIIANSIASLPFGVYKRTPDGRKPASDHPIHRLIHDQPNSITTSFTFKQLITAGLLTNGNGYAVIGRNQGGNVLDLFQVPPQDVTVDRLGKEPGSFRLRYEVRIDNQRFYPAQEQMLHVPGLGFDGIKGISVISAVARQSIATALTLEEVTARLHGRGLRPSGVVEQATGMKPDALARLKAAFEGTFGGAAEAGGTVILDKGLKWSPMSISPVDAATLESRRFQVADIARVFGVPLHLLNETEKSTSWGTGLEEQVKGFVEFVIGPWLAAIEQEFNRKLFRDPYYCKFNVGGLLRGDSKAQGEYFQKAISYAWMTPNEVREVLELPREEGGDTLFIAGNLRPINEPYTTGGSNNASNQNNAAT